MSSCGPRSASRLPLDFELDDAHVASASRRGAWARPRRRAADGLARRRRSGPRRVPRSRRSPRGRRPGRGQHVGHHARRRRRRAPRRTPDRGPCVDRSSPAGCGWSSRAGRCPAVRPCHSCCRPRRPSPASATAPRCALLRPAPGSQRLWLATVDDDVDLLAGARRRRPADPLLATSIATGRSTATRPSSPTSRGAPRCRARPGPSRPTSSTRLDPPRHRDRHDHAAHRRVVARGSRAAVCRALRGPARDRGRGQRHPSGRRSRDRRRHHRRAGARVGGRRDRHGASRQPGGPTP